MSKEYSAGAVIFRKEGKEIFYLLLHYRSRHWDFPKGHIESGESEIDTVKREVEEETGLKDIEIIDGFRQAIKYFFRVKNRTIFKTVAFYLAQTQEKEIKISEEHIGYIWLPYDKALKQITFKNGKQILERAHRLLDSNFAGG